MALPGVKFHPQKKANFRCTSGNCHPDKADLWSFGCAMLEMATAVFWHQNVHRKSSKKKKHHDVFGVFV